MNFGRSGIKARREYLRSRSRKRAAKLILGAGQLILIVIMGVCLAVGSLCVGAFRGVLESAPDMGEIDVSPKGYSSFVYDITGTQIAKLVSTDSNRLPVSSDMITPDLAHAFVAIEDERFYEHHGIDVPGIVRAAVLGITSGRFSEGASTITQQLIKNNVFTGWTSETSTERIKRKLQEQYLALDLEKRMSKDEILLNYLNTINLGHNTLGVEAASKRYFDKSCNELTISECAVLAAIPQNPSQYDPIVFPESNAERRDLVLQYMQNQGYITQADYEEAKADDVYTRIRDINVEKSQEENQINSYFVDALTDQILADLQEEAGMTEDEAYAELYSGGLEIIATQDPEIQAICDEECAEDSGNYPDYVRYILHYSEPFVREDGSTITYNSYDLSNWLAEQGWDSDLMYSDVDEAYSDVADFREANGITGEMKESAVYLAPQPEISLTVSDQTTGHVLAIVGGRGEKSANRTLNRATDSMRQPGSTFKIPTTYAPALDTGDFTLASSQVDEEYEYSSGIPVKNWYRGYRGLSTLRQGIVQSMNIVAVKTLTDITPRLGYEYAQQIGINTLVDGEEIDGKVFTDVNQTLALGGITYGVKNIELNACYATIANGGEYIEPKLYTTVKDHDGNILLDSSQNAEHRRVIKETTAWLLTSAMEDVVTEGTGRSVNFGTTAIAGKTGPTSDENDVWFSGYTPRYTATTWAGYDNNMDLTSTQEQALARDIWRAVMERLPGNDEEEEFEMPEGIETATVCKVSGQRPFGGVCPAVTEYFTEDTVPESNEWCHVHYEEYEEMKREEEEERQRQEEEERKKKEAEEAAKAAAAAKSDNPAAAPAEAVPAGAAE